MPRVASSEWSRQGVVCEDDPCCVPECSGFGGKQAIENMSLGCVSDFIQPEEYKELRGIVDPVDVGKIRRDLQILYLEYAAQCEKLSTRIHLSVEAELLDPSRCIAREANPERARTIDLSRSNPPLSDQQLRIFCISLHRANCGILEELRSLKFCDNLIGSTEAARAIRMLMCVGNGKLELDLSRNKNICDLDHAFLQLKRDLKRMDSDVYTMRLGLRRLVLDGTSVKNLSMDVCDILYGIESISLSYTKISNLWSTTSALRKLGLKSLSFQEPTRNSNSAMHPPRPGEKSRSRSSACRFRLDSPICREKAYRSFMLYQLTTLEVLDGVEVSFGERALAEEIVHEHYEMSRPVQKCERLDSLLRLRENGTTSLPVSWTGNADGNWMNVNKLCERVLEKRVDHPQISQPCAPNLKPRQFEYNPNVPEYLIFGSFDGGVYLLDHETGRMAGSSFMSSDAVIGLSWTNKSPFLFLAGSERGTIQLFDAAKMREKQDPILHCFPSFDQLTSLHMNCNDDQFIVSGYSKDVSIYDVEAGRVSAQFKDCHETHVNVVKFSHSSPNIFASSSFDHYVKLWDIREPSFNGIKTPIYTRRSTKPTVMACFSPDDRYILTSAVDNEVKQYQTSDGTLVRDYDIRPVHSPSNYTRSYFMNNGEYFVSGSCCENVVRIFRTSTGKLLREVEIDSRWFSTTWEEFSEKGIDDDHIFVQSLRGDPFTAFNFSVLAASHSSKSSTIVKLNLLKQLED
eukprot:CAMPEP_0184741772 /NCGR_PEP_ID=MMETSP0315-20130426/4782_1 /TAXON_ID=101924 /ORGANISM="Rhodosorus marinus, Strain UTEX LB 2760" /LENGTH=741 /DNA_ID=CAMNT_0027212259 /DNA_START=238 /DNA_END=2463 /DNA_ORIENTATION=-